MFEFFLKIINYRNIEIGESFKSSMELKCNL